MIVNGKKHKDFFVQTIEVDKTYQHATRQDFFLPFIKNKKILHVGFVDWPITKIENSLHLWVASHATKADGVDVNKEAAEKLRVKNGDIFFEWESIKDEYDVILVPEVLEHVDNIKEFFQTLNKFSGKLIITVPDAYMLQRHFEEANNFIEVVHPDHNCYFSPYTLKNIIKKYSNKKLTSLHWLQNHSIAAVCE
jgi:hypothetical protein